MTPNKRIDMMHVRPGRGFSLVEVVAAVTVLALIVSTCLVVIGRCLEATANLKIRMVAFGLARENMEKILGATAVSESVDYGDSNDVAGVTWETRIEPFYEPYAAKMWLKAYSSASWYDTSGEPQTIEFTQWLTELSPQDVESIMRRQQAQQAELDQETRIMIQGIYIRAIQARDAAETNGYEEMVALCRELIQYYPLTSAATNARTLLRDMPLSQKKAFDIKAYETRPEISPFDAVPGMSPQSPGSGGSTMGAP
jgi:prepilin-type N-terminal cleavage/methylation domain-containing protein